jgi:hypothetical protein
LNRQAIGIDDRMNLTGQPASRPAHCLSSVPSDACAVLRSALRRSVTGVS